MRRPLMRRQCSECGRDRKRFYLIGLVDGEYAQLGVHDYFKDARRQVHRLHAQGKLTDADGNITGGVWSADSAAEAIAGVAEKMRQRDEARAAQEATP